MRLTIHESYIYYLHLRKTGKENAPSELLYRAHLHAELLEATVRHFDAGIRLEFGTKGKLRFSSAPCKI